MDVNEQRVEEFRAEVAELRLPNANNSRDRSLLLAGSVLMAVGVVVALVAFFIGHGTTNALQQRDAIVIAVTGLTVAVVGSALFVRYSMAQFLRFWMARNSWEQSHQIDRLVEALGAER